MSTRFVAAGGAEVESPIENDDWARARRQVEERNKPQTDNTVGTQEGGKSLYEHLQAQKAAKQDAFEEATKIRNQFRPLDDSEIEFLESIHRSERAEAADLRKATAEQLDVFRREQAALERTSKEADVDEPGQELSTTDAWTSSRKLRRPQTDEVVDTSKLKKVLVTSESNKIGLSTNEDKDEKVGRPLETTSPIDTKSAAHEAEAVAASKKISAANIKTGSMLVSYDSDSDS